MKTLTALSLLAFSTPFLGAQHIEVSARRKPHTKDATVGYEPTPSEAKFEAKGPDSGTGGDTGFDAKKPGSLLGKVGKLVSWFAIVRALPSKASDTFLLEHKHFDGLNDYHMQLASLCGVGDFKLAATDPNGDVKRLSLVRVIGTVTGEADGVPTVKADYIRVWQLGDFAFMDYGADATNEKWKKLRQEVHLIYTSETDAAYYEKLLGR